MPEVDHSWSRTLSVKMVLSRSGPPSIASLPSKLEKKGSAVRKGMALEAESASSRCYFVENVEPTSERGHRLKTIIATRSLPESWRCAFGPAACGASSRARWARRARTPAAARPTARRTAKGLPVRGRRGGARADVRAGPARDVQKAAFLQKHQHRQHAAGVLAATTAASEDNVERAVEVQGDVGQDELVPRNHS